MNNLCTVETEDTINAKQLKNCLERCEMLRKFIEHYLQSEDYYESSFEKSPIHLLKEPVLDWLNNAFNIIRDFCLENYQIFPENAIKYMGLINHDKIQFQSEHNLNYSAWKIAHQTLIFVHKYIESIYDEMHA